MHASLGSLRLEVDRLHEVITQYPCLIFLTSAGVIELDCARFVVTRKFVQCNLLVSIAATASCSSFYSLLLVNSLVSDQLIHYRTKKKRFRNKNKQTDDFMLRTY